MPSFVRARRSLVVLLASGSLVAAILASCQGGGGTGGSGAASTASITGSGGSTGAVIIGSGGAMVCGSSGNDGGTGCEGLEGGVSLDAAQAILVGCTGEGCHLPPDLASLVGHAVSDCPDGRDYVKPGNAAQSYILDKIEGHDCCVGGRMPPSGNYLSAADTLTIRRWICEGAPTQ
jgi:hypothetical protein